MSDFELKTARGPYLMRLGKEPQALGDGLLLTLSLERRDGIETVSFECRVASALTSANVDEILRKLAHWIERDFEMTREYALKSIRSERKLLELTFDASNRGPF